MVTNKTFRVQSPNKTVEGSNWCRLSGLQEHSGIKTKVDPTLETKKNTPNTYPEWDIPDTDFNRAVMARHRPDYKIMEEVVEKPKPVVEKKEVKKELKKPTRGKKKMSPQQVGELKSKLKEELDSAGISYPKTASLSELQRLAIPTS